MTRTSPRTPPRSSARRTSALRLPKAWRTPHDVQRFLDEVQYSSDPVYRSPRQVLADAKAHCVDGALLAAAALRRQGHRPLVVWIHAENDDGHLVALWRRSGLWGAVAKSNFAGLRFREPVFRTVRELMMSYFNDYFNTDGDRSMRSWTRPLDLARFDSLDWETSDERLPEIIDGALDRQPTIAVAPGAVLKRLAPVDARLLEANLLGSNAAGLYKPKR